MLFEKYFIQKSEKYFTREQKDASDVDGNGYLTKEDLDQLYNLYQVYDGQFLGDANLDGQVNVQDIVELISVITSQEQSNIDLLVQDVNQDGFVNVIDVIEIINQIIGEN
jgi:hypothetical protein